jgi:geranylgeranyl reductase family protein
MINHATDTYSADVIVVGAGPAGSTAAALLARAGLHVLLVDRADFPRDKTCGDGLTPRAVAVLDRLAVLPALQARGYKTVSGALIVAPSGADFTAHFSAVPFGLPAFGMVVPRFELDDLLRRHAIEAGAQFVPGLHVTAPIYDARASGREQRVIGVRGERAGQPVTLAAPLTILATGASMGLLRAFGVLQRMPPGVNAIRGYFTGVEGLSDQFEFYFDRELNPGYGWIFPLADGRANVGLGLFNSRVSDGGTPNLRRLLAEFMARHPRLAAARPDGPIKGYPLRIDFPTGRPSGPGFLLAGETLGLVHPVTGEGIDLAMESAELAAAAAIDALRHPDTFPGGLRRYDHLLTRRYATFFWGARLLLRYATTPGALNTLIGKAQRKRYLAHTIAGINLGVVSPFAVFSPRVWWNILT